LVSMPVPIGTPLRTRAIAASRVVVTLSASFSFSREPRLTYPSPLPPSYLTSCRLPEVNYTFGAWLFFLFPRRYAIGFHHFLTRLIRRFVCLFFPPRKYPLSFQKVLRDVFFLGNYLKTLLRQMGRFPNSVGFLHISFQERSFAL